MRVGLDGDDAYVGVIGVVPESNGHLDTERAVRCLSPAELLLCLGQVRQAYVQEHPASVPATRMAELEQILSGELKRRTGGDP